MTLSYLRKIAHMEGLKLNYYPFKKVEFAGDVI